MGKKDANVVVTSVCPLCDRPNTFSHRYVFIKSGFNYPIRYDSHKNEFELVNSSTWIRMDDITPVKYGRYIVYNASADKIYFAVWNGTGWAYEHNNITHWMEITKPK